MTFFTWDRLEEYQLSFADAFERSQARDDIPFHIFEGAKGTKRIDTAILFAKTLICKSGCRLQPM